MLSPRAFIPSIPLVILLFFSIILPLIVAGFIAEDIWDKDRFHFEEPLMLWVHQHWGGVLTAPAVVLHHIGKASVATPITVVFATWFYLRKQRGYAVFVLLAALLPTMVMSVAKQFFGRMRPELWPRVVHETSASFPSGHSTFAAALATMVVLIYWQSPHRKWIIAAAAAQKMDYRRSRRICRDDGLFAHRVGRSLSDGCAGRLDYGYEYFGGLVSRFVP